MVPKPWSSLGFLEHKNPDKNYNVVNMLLTFDVCFAVDQLWSTFRFLFYNEAIVFVFKCKISWHIYLIWDLSYSIFFKLAKMYFLLFLPHFSWKVLLFITALRYCWIDDMHSTWFFSTLNHISYCRCHIRWRQEEKIGYSRYVLTPCLPNQCQYQFYLSRNHATFRSNSRFHTLAEKHDSEMISVNIDLLGGRDNIGRLEIIFKSNKIV